MGVLHDYYRAPDRSTAATTLKTPPVRASKRPDEPVFDAVDGKGIDPIVMLTTFQSLLTGVPYDELPQADFGDVAVGGEDPEHGRGRGGGDGDVGELLGIRVRHDRAVAVARTRSARRMKKTLDMIDTPLVVRMTSNAGRVVCAVVCAAPDTIPPARPACTIIGPKWALAAAAPSRGRRNRADRAWATSATVGASSMATSGIA